MHQGTHPPSFSFEGLHLSQSIGTAGDSIEDDVDMCGKGDRVELLPSRFSPVAMLCSAAYHCRHLYLHALDTQRPGTFILDFEPSSYISQDSKMPFLECWPRRRYC